MRVDEKPLSEPSQSLDRSLSVDIRGTACGFRRRDNPTLKRRPIMLINQEHFDKVREFARSVGTDAELQKHLDFLAGFGGAPAKVRCRLYSDFAPHSFFWRMEYSSREGWKTGLVGGLSYSSPGAPSDGSRHPSASA
jgi:hypothetical protein